MHLTGLALRGRPIALSAIFVNSSQPVHAEGTDSRLPRKNVFDVCIVEIWAEPFFCSKIRGIKANKASEVGSLRAAEPRDASTDF